MSRPFRIGLIVLALALVVLALVALVYALAPAPLLRGSFPVEPTLLVPPGAAP